MPISAVPMSFAVGPCTPVPSEVDGDWPAFRSPSLLMKNHPSRCSFSQTVCQLAGVWRNPGTFPLTTHRTKLLSAGVNSPGELAGGGEELCFAEGAV